MRACVIIINSVGLAMKFHYDGLSSREVAAARETHGANELPPPEVETFMEKCVRAAAACMSEPPAIPIRLLWPADKHSRTRVLLRARCCFGRLASRVDSLFATCFRAAVVCLTQAVGQL